MTLLPRYYQAFPPAKRYRKKPFYIYLLAFTLISGLLLWTYPRLRRWRDHLAYATRPMWDHDGEF